MRLINYYSFLLVISVFFGCNTQSNNELVLAKDIAPIPEIESTVVDKKQIKLNSTKGQWYYNDQPFNGYAVSYYDDSGLAEKSGFFDGKREGKSYSYFNDGTIKKEALYKKNKLDGVKLTYFRNGVLASESNYVNGKKHGFQKVWFPDGQLAKKKYLNQGKEDGLQQAWLENGSLYINYEAKNGRIFGMLRANSCYKLKDEKVVRKE